MAEFDVCVIGAGPVGMTVAMEFAERGWTVALVESGGESPSPDTQALSEAVVDTPASHSVMNEAVCRALGGTSRFWGGRCVPLDPVDLMARPHIENSGWPLNHEDVRKYHAKASRYMGIGDPSFRVDHCGKNIQKTKQIFDSLPPDGRGEGYVLANTLERWTPQPNWWVLHGDSVKQNANITIISGWTCIDFKHGSLHGEVKAAILVSSLEVTQRRELTAKTYVMANGGVESVRLILNSIESPDGLRLENSSLVGKYYMGHPSGKIADIHMPGDPQETIYDYELDGGVYVRRRLTFSESFLNSKELMNIAFWLDNPPLPDPSHGNGLLSAAYLALTTPGVGNRLVPDAIRKHVAGEHQQQSWAHIKNCVLQPIDTARSVGRFAYRRFVQKPRVPGFMTFSANNRYALHFHAEQSPDKANCIELTDEKCKIGLRKARIRLNWHPRDIESIKRAHRELDSYLRRHVVGGGGLRYRFTEAEMDEAIVRQSFDGFHQLGGLRMGKDASDGVTDSFGRVFGCSNLYVASCAVFPTSGQANPTFTAVALAIRQAEHIAGVKSN
jgi:hypothetical protein